MHFKLSHERFLVPLRCVTNDIDEFPHSASRHWYRREESPSEKNRVGKRLMSFCDIFKSKIDNDTFNSIYFVTKYKIIFIFFGNIILSY